MYELRHMSATNTDVKAVEEVLGGFNNFPPGWEEISMEGFIVVSGGSFLPVYIDYRQMRPDKGPMISAMLYIYRDLTGYAIIADRVDQTLSYFRFDGLTKLKMIFNNLPVVSDSGWRLDKDTSLIDRGISDFNRAISFERALTIEEELLVQIYLLRDNCPGWTGVMSDKRKDNVYVYRTTYDSSD